MRSLVAAAVVAVLVAVVGVLVVLRGPDGYRATATVVVLPGPSTAGPTYFRALADGEVAAGFAAAIVAIADASSGGGPGRVDVVLAPHTSALTVSAVAGTPAAATTAANAVADESVRELGLSRPPFVLVPVARAEAADSRPVGAGPGPSLVVVACVAAASALAAAQTTWLWSAFGRRSRGRS